MTLCRKTSMPIDFTSWGTTYPLPLRNAWALAATVRYMEARGEAPTRDRHEGFRLLALHRQGARGEPSFNACRETCRELVYRCNLMRLGASGEGEHQARLAVMVARHLGLFVRGKLEESELGEFCCSSRPLRAVGGR